MQRTLGSAVALLCTALGLTLIQASTTAASRTGDIDPARRVAELPAPTRLTGIAAGDARADDETAERRRRVVCAL